MKYCNACKENYGLNNRIFNLFANSCDICSSKTTTVNIDDDAFIDHNLNTIIFKKSMKIQINKRQSIVFINTFSVLKEEHIKWWL